MIAKAKSTRVGPQTNLGYDLIQGSSYRGHQNDIMTLRSARLIPRHRVVHGSNPTPTHPANKTSLQSKRKLFF